MRNCYTYSEFLFLFTRKHLTCSESHVIKLISSCISLAGHSHVSWYRPFSRTLELYGRLMLAEGFQMQQRLL